MCNLLKAVLLISGTILFLVFTACSDSSSSSSGAQVSTPVFDPIEGIYSENKSITITCATSGVTIYYTTDGGIPTTSSNIYSKPVVVEGNGTVVNIAAIAVKSGMADSAIATATFQLSWHEGEALWAYTASSASSLVHVNSVTVDSSGNTYTAGYVNGTGSFNFGGITSPFNGKYMYYSAVIVKYDPYGIAQWAIPVSSASGGCEFKGVAVDTSGNVYAAGDVNGTGSFDFGGSSSPFNGKGTGSSSVIVKYNSSGVAQWAIPISSASSSNNFIGVAVDGSGNAYAVGWVLGTGSFDFGGGSSSFNGKYMYGCTVIVKYNSSGVAQWAVPVSSATNMSYFNGVAADSSGNAYAAGYVWGTGAFDFGGSSVSFNGKNSSESAVIVKYNSSGAAQWAIPVSNAPDKSEFTGVTADGSGNVYAVGYIYGNSATSFNFGGIGYGYVKGLSSSNNAVIVKYNSSGVAQWAMTLNSAADASSFNGVTADSSGNVYAVGYVWGTGAFDFGGRSSSFAGAYVGSNSVIVKYNGIGEAEWATPVNFAKSYSAFTGAAIDGSGYVYAVGYIDGYGSFDFGGDSSPFIGASTSDNSLIVKYHY